MITTQRSVRLLGKKTLELNRTTGSPGEVFYDTDTQSLRIYASNGASVVVATRAWVTANSLQSDWLQATSTAADFIKNKPAIPTNTNQLTNGAGFITSTGIPSQTGNSGKYLTTNGTAVSWATVTATVTASDVGLGNVTNESKATMFASPALTGTVTSAGDINISAGFGVQVAGATSSAKLYHNANYNQLITTSGTTGVLFNASQVGIKANYVDVLLMQSNLISTRVPIQFTGSASGQVTLQAPASAPTAPTFTLPAAYPSADGYALVSTTGGVLSWAAAGGGGGAGNAYGWFIN
jgi:hypothetical protein